MKTYKINSIENKRILGRTLYDAKEDSSNLKKDALCLFWGASALEVNVKSSDLWVLISAQYDNQPIWVSVEVNGSQVSRFIVPKTPQWFCVSSGMNKENETLVSIIKDSQPMNSEANHELYIHEIGFSDSGEFCNIPPRKLNIEFIGDSITSGEGLAGLPFEMDWITQWMCASKTYARKCCLELNANYSVLSQCGWGICWGWDGNKNNNLPKYYNQICGLLTKPNQISYGSTCEYNFSVKNDFVVLNLGTNDNGAFFQPAWKDENGIEYPLHVDENKRAIEEDGKKVSEGVYNFLVNIRKNNEKAKIIWTWGMIKLVAIPDFVKDGINRYKKDYNDENVFWLEFDSMEDVELKEEDKGSRGHPGPKTHNLAAKKLTEFIKQIM